MVQLNLRMLKLNKKFLISILHRCRIITYIVIMKRDLSKFLDFKPYKPSKGEEYMSPKQIEHFKKILDRVEKICL